MNLRAKKPDPVVIIWCLFAAYALATFGLRLVQLINAEWLGLDTNIVDRDFVNYWMGGKLVLEGNHQLLFDDVGYYENLRSLFGPRFQEHYWSYPPHFLLLVTPLGLLGYGWALAAFLTLTFLLFAASVRVFVKRFAPATPPGLLALGLLGYALMMIDTTQNGFLTAALVLFAISYLETRPVLAGLALALLTTKPQIGFLIPLLALFDRRWQALGWASVFTVLLVSVSLALFGTQSWQAFFTQVLPDQQLVMTQWEGIFKSMMPSIFGTLRRLRYAPDVAFFIQALVSALTLAIVIRFLMLMRDPLDRAYAIVIGTFLITPYSFNYDLGPVSAVAACLALRERAAGQWRLASVHAVVAGLPCVVTYLGLHRVPLSPLVLMCGLAALYVGWQRRPRDVAAAEL